MNVNQALIPKIHTVDPIKDASLLINYDSENALTIIVLVLIMTIFSAMFILAFQHDKKVSPLYMDCDDLIC